MGHVFISYSHKDTDYAHRLADTLQSDGFDVWIDARLDYGSQWPNELQKQLDACDAFILIMTPRSFASEWVQNELQRAKRKLKPVFPLLLEGDEPWLSVESTQYYDVCGEKLPDLKFYSALRRVASRHEGEAIQLPDDRAAESFKPTSSADPPKSKTAIVIAIIGAIATLVAAIILFIWSNRSQNATLPPADNRTVTSPTSFSNETLSPNVTSIISSVMPGETSAPSDFIVSKGVRMLLVPAGEFTMGRSASDQFADCQELNQECQLSWFMDEEPIHKVYLDAFYIDVYEVTNALYKVCAEQGVCDPPQASNSNSRVNYYGNPEFDNYPVIYVSWIQAKTYCEWREARLPTEAEWEKAARGTDARIYPWGNELDETYANYNLDIGDTTEVGSYESGKSPYHVYDMAGNVWEWVADWYSETYYQRSPTENPPGPASGDYRGLRGGSWGLVGVSVSASYRYASDPTEPNLDLGFRCAMDAIP